MYSPEAMTHYTTLLNQSSRMILVPPAHAAQIWPYSGQSWPKSGQI